MKPPPSKRLPLILLEMNEINFDIVKEYIDADPSLFPALQELMAGRMINTNAELEYDEIEAIFDSCIIFIIYDMIFIDIFVHINIFLIIFNKICIMIC